MYLLSRSVTGTWYLNHVHGSSGKPRPFQLPQKRLLSDEAPDSGREPKHLVEADCHCIGRRIAKRYFRGRGEGGSIKERGVSKVGSVCDQ